MKNILMYTDTPQTGGAELQIFLLAKFLNKENFTPILACSKNKNLDKWCEKFEKENIKVIRLNVAHKHDPRHLFQLKKLIKKLEIDILHAHVWNPASCRYAYSAAKSTGVKLITTEHDPFSLNTIKNFFKKRGLKNVDKIVTVSKADKKMIQDLYPKHQEKVAVINCGLDITWWQSQLLSFNLKERKEVKEKIFNAPENTLIIVTVGELHKRKGHDILIKAMSPLVEKFPNIKLAIVGEGEERNNLEALIKKRKLAKNVILTGRQGNIPHIMTSSDIFVLPSRREAFGIVNLEAMFCGLPIIAHKLNGTTDIIEEGKSGFLVDQKEPNQLAEALEFMIKNENLRTKMGLKGHMTVKNKFSAKQMAKAYEEIYKNS